MYEEGNGWVWERRSMYGDLISRSDRAWENRQEAIREAGDEAAAGGTLVAEER
jgi:hypothetical protein